MRPKRPVHTALLAKKDNVRRQFQRAIAAVTHPDDAVRRANLELTRNLPPAELRLLIAGLIQVVRNRRQAVW